MHIFFSVRLVQENSEEHHIKMNGDHDSTPGEQKPMMNGGLNSMPIDKPGKELLFECK